MQSLVKVADRYIPHLAIVASTVHGEDRIDEVEIDSALKRQFPLTDVA
jgi:hypothetical protein